MLGMHHAFEKGMDHLLENMIKVRSDVIHFFFTLRVQMSNILDIPLMSLTFHLFTSKMMRSSVNVWKNIAEN